MGEKMSIDLFLPTPTKFAQIKQQYSDWLANHQYLRPHSQMQFIREQQERAHFQQMYLQNKKPRYSCDSSNYCFD